MTDLYRAIWRHTGRQQLLVILLTLIVAALAAVPLDYQKRIINGMGEGRDFEPLLVLGLEMVLVILVSLVLKALLRYRSEIIGESIIRHVRTLGVKRASAAGEGDQRQDDRGTLANIVSSESEAVGRFVGGSIAEPLLQAGTLVSVIGYIAVMQPMLGLVAAIMVLPQAVLVILTQSKVNELVRERVVVLRGALDTLSAGGLDAVQSAVLEDFDRLYDNRRRIFLWKTSVKMVLGMINGAALVAVLVFGGWLVIQGRGDVGSVVAATVGLGRIQGPWKELIAFFRSMSVVRVQFELLRSFTGPESRPIAPAPQG